MAGDTRSPSRTGERGERAAERHLLRTGYRILERNYRYGRYEIDLIAAKDDWTVFVEVKTRTGSGFGAPETFVTPYKISCIQRAAQHYRESHEGRFWRYDVIAVTIKENSTGIRHFEDAFWV